MNSVLREKRVDCSCLKIMGKVRKMLPMHHWWESLNKSPRTRLFSALAAGSMLLPLSNGASACLNCRNHQCCCCCVADPTSRGPEPAPGKEELLPSPSPATNESGVPFPVQETPTSSGPVPPTKTSSTEEELPLPQKLPIGPRPKVPRPAPDIRLPDEELPPPTPNSTAAPNPQRAD